MANCKFCGRAVRFCPVYHAACWEREVHNIMGTFCDDHCRWPRECQSQEELEEHCESCPVDKLVDLGVKGGQRCE